MTNKYCISGVYSAICRIGVVTQPGISLQDFMRDIRNVEESWTCQEIYDVGKVNLKAKWPGSVEKHKFDTKCTEIN